MELDTDKISHLNRGAVERAVAIYRGSDWKKRIPVDQAARIYCHEHGPVGWQQLQNEAANAIVRACRRDGRPIDPLQLSIAMTIAEQAVLAELTPDELPQVDANGKQLGTLDMTMLGQPLLTVLADEASFVDEAGESPSEKPSKRSKKGADPAEAEQYVPGGPDPAEPWSNPRVDDGTVQPTAAADRTREEWLAEHKDDLDAITGGKDAPAVDAEDLFGEHPTFAGPPTEEPVSRDSLEAAIGRPPVDGYAHYVATPRTTAPTVDAEDLFEGLDEAS